MSNKKNAEPTERLKRSSDKWCSCGYHNRRGAKGFHEDGTHHKAGKK